MSDVKRSDIHERLGRRDFRDVARHSFMLAEGVSPKTFLWQAKYLSVKNIGWTFSKAAQENGYRTLGALENVPIGIFAAETGITRRCFNYAMSELAWDGVSLVDEKGNPDPRYKDSGKILDTFGLTRK